MSEKDTIMREIEMTIEEMENDSVEIRGLTERKRAIEKELEEVTTKLEALENSIRTSQHGLMEYIRKKLNIRGALEE